MTNGLGRTALRAVALAVAILAGGAQSAHAVYSAQWLGQSVYPTIEGGDTAELYIAFKNTGDQTWYRDGAVRVRLGASNPFDRNSPFYNPADWVNAGRPTGLDQTAVAPGVNGTFTFVARAPATAGVLREHYAPVADGPGGTWMLPGDAVWLDYTVLAAQPPVVKVTSAPQRIDPGDPIRVSADVTDNRGVARVSFEVGSQVVALTAPSTGHSYEAELPSAELGTGTHTVLVRGTDLGGREAVETATFEVAGTTTAVATPPPAAPTPPVVDADGDGVSAPLDCDDRDPAIRPGIADVPGDGIDQDCAAGDAGYPELTATTTFNYSYRATTLVRRIDITRLKGGETATIRCTGRRCPFTVRTFAGLKAGSRSFGRSLLRGRRLPAGTTMSVRVTRPQTIGTYTALTVRRGRAAKITRACLRPGSNVPSPCL